MSAFTFETRTCTCGREWEALDFWPDDVVCDDCGTRQYEARLAEINEGRTYHVESIGGMCPTQAEGRLPDGRHFYYRARHGVWTLSVANSQREAYMAAPIASGDDPTHGGVADEDVVAVLDQHLGGKP